MVWGKSKAKAKTPEPVVEPAVQEIKPLEIPAPVATPDPVVEPTQEVTQSVEAQPEAKRYSAFTQQQREGIYDSETKTVVSESIWETLATILNELQEIKKLAE